MTAQGRGAVALAAALAFAQATLASPRPPWEELPPIVATLEDDFSKGIDAGRWMVFGDPSPAVVEERHGRSGLFDNRGDGMGDSGMVSAFLVRAGAGCVLEMDVFIEVTDPAGCWLGQAMGITLDPNPAVGSPGQDVDVARAIELRLQYNGDACWGEPEADRRHGWLRLASAEWETRLIADDLLGRWVRLGIEFTPAGRVRLLVDGAVLAEGKGAVDGRALRLQRIVLLGRSHGSAGRVWVDRVSFRSGVAR